MTFFLFLWCLNFCVSKHACLYIIFRINVQSFQSHWIMSLWNVNRMECIVCGGLHGNFLIISSIEKFDSFKWAILKKKKWKKSCTYKLPQCGKHKLNILKKHRNNAFYLKYRYMINHIYNQIGTIYALCSDWKKATQTQIIYRIHIQGNHVRIFDGC